MNACYFNTNPILHITKKITPMNDLKTRTLPSRFCPTQTFTLSNGYCFWQADLARTTATELNRTVSLVHLGDGA
jgi:hypothetical protein